MGGEKQTWCYEHKEQIGSPPHGRGKDDDLVLMMADLRITPAWAGKSPFTPAQPLSCEDHPRMGGEKPLH